MGRASTADEQGRAWNASAPVWADLWSGLAEPARIVLLDGTAYLGTIGGVRALRDG